MHAQWPTRSDSQHIKPKPKKPHYGFLECVNSVSKNKPKSLLVIPFKVNVGLVNEASHDFSFVPWMNSAIILKL